MMTIEGENSFVFSEARTWSAMQRLNAKGIQLPRSTRATQSDETEERVDGGPWATQWRTKEDLEQPMVVNVAPTVRSMSLILAAVDNVAATELWRRNMAHARTRQNSASAEGVGEVSTTGPRTHTHWR